MSAAILHRAEQLCADAGERLTTARINAYAELLSQPRPISAYELLDLLERREGRKLAPLTVYRQLDFLVRVGLVHKLASTQVYMACEHPEHPHDGLYLVCSFCGKADELESDNLNQLLGRAAKSRGFKSQKRIVEVQGMCHDCGGKA
ncbi:MAG: Fur family transcriptional regulator [Panacagrimonas sp.]